MTVLQALILGILQGITEFLPISSSGHLVIAQKLFGIAEPPIFFDALIHFGTLFAVFFYFRKKLWNLCSGIIRWDKEAIAVFISLIFGTIPIVIVGLLIKDSIGIIFNSLKLVGFAYIVMAFILFATRKKYSQDKKNALEGDVKNKIGIIDALFIGLFQAFAILPGISRSGSTISAGIFRKLDRNLAFEFSFLLMIPAILGALTIEIIGNSGFALENTGSAIIGLIASAIFGFLTLNFLKKVLVSSKFFLFGFYCLALGIVVVYFAT